MNENWLKKNKKKTESLKKFLKTTSSFYYWYCEHVRMLILAFSWKLHSSLTLNFPTLIVFPLRLFHHPSLYKHFHKQHHEWTAPIGVVSIYAHPLEHMVNDRPPVDLSIVVECTEGLKENATLGVYCGGSTRVCRCLFRFSPGWVTAAAAVTDKSSRLHFHIRNLNSSLNMKEYLNSSRFHSFNPEWMNEHVLFLLAVRSPTCCRWQWGRCSWAPTWPPPPCGTAWLWSAPPSPTVDTTCPSCPLLNSTTSTTSGESTCPLSLLLFIFWTAVSLLFTVPSHPHRPTPWRKFFTFYTECGGSSVTVPRGHHSTIHAITLSFCWRCTSLLNSHKVSCLSLVLICLTWSCPTKSSLAL